MADNNIGIEAVGFSTSNIEFSLKDFAIAKEQDPAKFENGLWQKNMSIVSPLDDVITLAYNAVSDFLTDDLKNKIDLAGKAISSDETFITEMSNEELKKVLSLRI